MDGISPLAFTVDEAIAASKMSRTEIYRAFRSGSLTAKKQGRRTLILKADLERFLNALPSAYAA
jgi:excisionase family DNA binding protein